MRSSNHLPCSLLEFYTGAASECVAQGLVLYRAPNAPWLLLFASSCEGKGNNECKSHAPMGHRSEDELEFRMQRCHAGQRSAAAARSCLRQDGDQRTDSHPCIRFLADPAFQEDPTNSLTLARLVCSKRKTQTSTKLAEGATNNIKAK